MLKKKKRVTRSDELFWFIFTGLKLLLWEQQVALFSALSLKFIIHYLLSTKWKTEKVSD